MSKETIIAASLLALILILSGSQFAKASSFEDGSTAFREHDYDSASDKWRQLAEQGDAKAQFNLGLLYAKGLGVKQSNAEAAKWYLRAARRGDVRAQNNLAVCYATGKGVAQNLIKSYFWFSLAATQVGGEIATASRNKMAHHLSATQIVDTQKLVRNWKPSPPTPITAAVSPPPLRSPKVRGQ